MTQSPIVPELRSAALISGDRAPVLTDKGREWLRVLEDLQSEEIVTESETPDDLILSTSGLVR